MSSLKCNTTTLRFWRIFSLRNKKARNCALLILDNQRKLCISCQSRDRVANGGLAAYFDKKLADEFGAKPGILLEPQYVGKLAPDPAKIHHVIETTEHDPNLQKRAKDYHAITLYGGMALHSLGVFLVTLMANQFTKWQVQAKKAKL